MAVLEALPTELGSQIFMNHILLYGNYSEKMAISGTLPTQLGNMSDLVVFTAEFNRLSGTIPVELSGPDCMNRAYSYDMIVDPPPRYDPILPKFKENLRDLPSPHDGPRGPQLPETALYHWVSSPQELASGGAAHALIQSEFNPILSCTKILSGANVSTTQYLSHGGRRSYSSMNSISLRGSCAIERPHPGRVLCAGHSHL